MRLEEGARLRRDGKAPYIQAYVRVRPGPQGVKFTRFPLTSTRVERDAWREKMIRQFGDRPLMAGSFAAKVEEYLAQNQSKKTIAQAAQHLGLWMDMLGRDRDPLTITTDEINQVIDRWLTEADVLAPTQRGRRPAARGYAAGTVRKRRMWLRQFFVFLIGDGGPVQKAENPREPKPGPRGIDMLVCERAIAAMPKYQSTKKGATPVLSLAPIRARVLLHTGLPPQVLMAVRPEHLDFEAGTLYVAGREKGAGLEERTLSLMPDAVSAFREFHAAGAYGPFSGSSLGRALKAGFTRSGYLRQLRLYDVRHSFLTFVYRVTRDLATVGRLGLHAEGSTVPARYALGANQEVDEAAVAAMSQVLAQKRKGVLKAAPGAKGRGR
jgi:integrase